MARDVSGLELTDREHLAGCVACRVRASRLWHAAAPGEPGDDAVTRILHASGPGLALPDEIDAAFADDAPHPGEIWRIGRDEALLVWVRRVLDDAIDVVPVVLDIALADQESVLLPAESTSLGVPLALLTGVRGHVGPAALLQWIGKADVAGQVREVMNAALEGRLPAGVEVGPPITATDDQRIEYRQVIADLLADLSPEQWDAGTPLIVGDDTSPATRERDIKEQENLFLPDFAAAQIGSADDSGNFPENGLTLDGAIKILVRHDPARINKLVGILSELFPSAGSTSGHVTSRLRKMFATIWGWLDPKGAALSLLHDELGEIPGKISELRGNDRREVIAAIHSIIAVTAFFESFRNNVGTRLDLRHSVITEKEIRRSLSRRSHLFGVTISALLYTTEIPTPSAARDLRENGLQVQRWHDLLSREIAEFLSRLEIAEISRSDLAAIVDDGTEHYLSYFLRLADEIPEFEVWTMLGDGAETGITIKGPQPKVKESRKALGWVGALLELNSGHDTVLGEPRRSLASSNGIFLSEPIISIADRMQQGIEFPTIGDGYVNPRYRVALAGHQLRVADERYWENQPPRENLDLMLAGYVTSPEATRMPLLLVGDPGAGKSLLSKVIAARLPAAAYTAVRVPLRRALTRELLEVQVDQALRNATNGKLDSWRRLTELSADTSLVLILDGLDEMPGTSPAGRDDYLQEVMDFQRHEAERHRPIVAMVTARTLVADRVDIPPGTTVVKLDMFNEANIIDWLHQWQKVNAPLMATGKIRRMTDAVALRHLDLARHPILLQMLAFYAANPALPGLDEMLSPGADPDRAARRLEKEIAKLSSHLTEELRLTVLASLGRPSAARDQGPINSDDIPARESETLNKQPSRKSQVREFKSDPLIPERARLAGSDEAFAAPASGSFLDRLDTAERRSFLSIARKRTFVRGARIMREGEFADFVLVIMDGWTRITMHETGGERVLAERGPGELIGERAALRVNVRSATVTALGTIHALVMRTEDFASFVDAHPRVLDILERQVYDRLTEEPEPGKLGVEPDVAAETGSRRSADSPERPLLAGENCTVLLTDIVGFGSRIRNDEERRHVRLSSRDIVRETLDDTWDKCIVEDRGDGLLIIVPPHIPTASVIAALQRELPDRLRRHNRTYSEARRIRLRVAANVGPVVSDDFGISGEAIIRTARLIEAPVLKDAMSASKATLGMMVSEFVYDTAIRQVEWTSPSDYEQVSVRVKESDTTGWMCIVDLPIGVPQFS
jgi:CRP-like cAMP-binding protein